jgi:hypothetical protein
MKAALGAIAQMLYCNILSRRIGFQGFPVEVHIGMKWFRSNIRLGSRLALFALAIQFLLSFGHSHGGGAQAAAALFGPKPSELHETGGAAAMRLGALVSVRQRTSSNDEPNGQPTDDCAICAVIALAKALVVATPPGLPELPAAAFSRLNTNNEFVDPDSTYVAFQPRAPPIC